MSYFLEGFGSGIVLCIGGVFAVGIGVKAYFKAHPEKLYSAIVHRKTPKS